MIIMEKKLDLILQKLEILDTGQNHLKTGQQELKEIVIALRDRHEETDAKLENLTMDVHKMHGDVTSIKEQLSELQSEVEFTYQKTAKNEMELFKIKRDFN